MDASRLCMGCMGDGGGAASCPQCQWDANAPPDSPLYLKARTILNGQYLVGRVLGHGGFGITYLGWDLNLARKIAIKEYFPAGIAMRPADGERVSAYSAAMQKDFQWGLDRYLEEARVLARFDHPNISAVINFFSANGTAYMILDYLDGMTFEKLLERRGGKVPWETVEQIIVPVMDALREVHKTDILHRDISPDNIYILKTGQIKVIDFGAARYALGQQSKNLSIILKEGYAPEEQYRSKGNQGPWTDVYATAATMYRALTGKVPVAALDRQRQDELERPSALGVAIPPEKERALWKALAVQAEERFQDMAAFQNAVLAEAGAAIPPPVPVPVPPKPPQPAVDPNAATVPVVKPAPPRPRPIPPPVPPRRPVGLLVLAAVAVLAVVAVALKLSGHKAPEIAAFTTSPASLSPGAAATLQWSVNNASPDDVVTILPGVGTVAASGSSVVQPTSNVTYTLTVRTKDGKEVSKAVQVAVTAPAGPEIVAFQADPASVAPGQPVTLRWKVSGAERVEIQGLGEVPAEGDRTVTLQSSADVVLVATGSGRQATQTASITVSPGQQQPQQERQAVPSRENPMRNNRVVPPQPQPQPQPPPVTELRIVDFGVTPATITAGQAATLHWNVAGASSVVISPMPGRVAPSGQMGIAPEVSTNFQLVAANPQGRTITASTAANVTQWRTPAVVTPAPPRQAPQSGMSWIVFHDHDGILGMAMNLNRYRQQQWNYCQGQLSIAGNHLRYNSPQQPAHNFDVPVTDVEAKTIRRTIQGRRAFEVRIAGGGHYNFVSQSNPEDIIAAIERASR